MKLVTSILLGSASALVAVGGAQAADLPVRKAAPVEYVKVCDAYGAGFFYIPGTDTCIKVGGRVRADFAMSGRTNRYATNVFAPGVGGNIVGGYVYNNAITAPVTASSTSGFGGPAGSTFALGAFAPGAATGTLAGFVVANGISGRASNLYGWEARGRVDLDARTQTAWGTVQAVASIRLARTTGVLTDAGPGTTSSSASPTLEAAYIRFAGFTFGAARDNFSFMPSTFYGAGHWSSFANGAKQIAYTAVLGGGVSATLAIQDATDTTAGGVLANGFVTTEGILVGTNFFDPTGASGGVLTTYAYNQMPQINGRIDFDQGWGSASVMGAVGRARGLNTTATFDESKTTYAVGAGLKLNLPMIAAGDVLWLNAAYANGMTEYTTNWTSFKSSDTKLNVGGYVVNHPSWIVTPGGIETLKSWDVAAVYTHYWAPQWRHSFLASYGRIEGTNTSKALAWSQPGAFGDATVWNVGTQLAWLPTRNFEIGVDVLYARVEQDIRRLSGVNTVSGAASPFTLTPSGYATNVTREKSGNWTGRLRVERTF